jgi:UPF0716 protein FxsA
VVAGLLLVPVVELVGLITAIRWVGLPLTLIGLALAFGAGVLLIRTVGMTAGARLLSGLTGGRLPTRELADGAITLLAGLLLVFPGFVSDVVALLLLVPGPRRPLRRRIERALPVPGRRGRGGGAGGRSPGPDVIEGEVIDREVIDGETPE